MTAHVIYLITDDLESMPSLLRFGNNADGKSSKALDITEEVENWRIQCLVRNQASITNDSVNFPTHHAVAQVKS